MSDTCGNLSGVLTAIEHMRAQGVAKIFHLGGYYSDIQKYIEMRKTILTRNNKYDDTDFLSDFSSFLAKQSGIPQRPSKDLDEIAWLKKNVLQVPAESDLEYNDENIKRSDFEMMAGKFIAISHSPKALSKEDIASANVILYGQTRKYQVDAMQGRFFVNPGHLDKNDSVSGRPPTFGILDLEPDCLTFTVYDLQKQVVFEKELENTRKRKFKTT